MQKDKINSIILASITGILLILSFPRSNLWFLAWFSFLPLFFSLKNKSIIWAFLLSYISGIIFFSGTIYWLTQVTFLGAVVLILYLALYFGLFGLIVSSYLLPTTYYLLLFVPSIWVLLEYLRTHLFTGFGWALLGYSQYLNLPIIQIADITGVWGVSFLVMMVNVAIYSFIVHRSSFLVKKRYIFPILCIFITLIYGFYRIYIAEIKTHDAKLKISVIQANIPQELKWDANAKDFIIKKYLNLTREAIKDGPDLIIWPEAALPSVLEKDESCYEKVRGFLKRYRTPLLLGAVTSKEDFYYNSAVLISKQGRLLKQYNKLHLVPFGEYIPLKNILRFLETVVPIGDFVAGREYTVFTLPTIYYLLPTKFSVLICFEDIFPEISRRFVKKEGANFLVNITNDAWFGKTASAYQHLQASVFRAVENRRFLIRAANTGISGFIDPQGRIISTVTDREGEQIFISGHKTEQIQTKRNLAFYTRYADTFVLLISLVVLCGIIRKNRFFI